MNNCCFKFNNQLFSFGGGEEFIEVANYAALPVTGSTSVIYVTLDDNKIYRWTGSTYVELSGGGETPSYSVYTALLTQSGGDDPVTWANNKNGILVIGVTYEIANYANGDDFTNIGAPSNANGVKFVATGTTAATWSGATELNFNTAAPIVTVLENTIGNIWFTYMSTGSYSINSSGLFTINKTTFFITLMGDDTTNGSICKGTNSDINSCGITTGDLSGGYDSILSWETPIEIRVYN